MCRRVPWRGCQPARFNVGFNVGFIVIVIGSAGLIARGAHAQTGGGSLVNWENPHVHPLDVTPDGARLLAVNTADNRLQVFDITSGTAIALGAVPVGLDPVSVRARTSTEAWVVNHISDSISIVNLSSMNVIATLRTADEPCDVVFAAPPGSPPNPHRAFVTCSQANRVQVFDPLALGAAPIDIPIVGEDPRAMAVSPDGSKVYVAVFESGNGTTILGGGATTTNFFPPNVVSDPSGPYAGQNPPPNAGTLFDPPLNAANPPPPPVGLIVRKSDAGQWLDDNGGDWTAMVSGAQANLSGRPAGWDLWDHDLAVIDAQSLAVSYHTRLMNLCMAVAVNPATGQIAVVGTDAMNHVRFEPNLNGRFLRTHVAVLEEGGGASQIVDLNPHLAYDGPTVAPALREQSVGDPRGIVWNNAGTAGYVTGMGSDNVVVIGAGGQRAGPPIEVGQGPTGLALDEPHARLYVLNKFDGSISVISLASQREIARVGFFDPTPAAIRLGRRHLYDGHATSGLGHTSCASCHPDGRMDRLAWDLGNPAGDMIGFDQNCNFGSSTLAPPGTPCPDWHPMKGSMVTQTLQDIIGKEPHHWRGDRDGIEEFNQTFTNLQGAERELSAVQMQELEDFLATITLPPNPFRNLNNTLPASLPLPGQYFTGVGGASGTPLPNGSAGAGLGHFNNHHLVQGFAVSCSTCHTLPSGTGTNSYFSPGVGFTPFHPGPNGELHHAVVFSNLSETPSMSIKVPHLRNLHEKVGFEMTQVRSLAGFGFLHDGSVDSLARFMGNPPFVFHLLIDGPPEVKIPRMVALMMTFSGSNLGFGGTSGGPLSRDTHAAVGRQVTFNTSEPDPNLVAELNALLAIANATPGAAPAPRISLVAKGVQQGLARGYAYIGGGVFQPDRQSEAALSASALIAAAGSGAEVTFTTVPLGTQTRIGIDRDEDGYFDRDELDAGSNPADPNSIPTVPGDINNDGVVNIDDLLLVIAAWGPCAACVACPPDVTGDCTVDINDLLLVISNWG